MTEWLDAARQANEPGGGVAAMAEATSSNAPARKRKSKRRSRGVKSFRSAEGLARVTIGALVLFSAASAAAGVPGGLEVLVIGSVFLAWFWRLYGNLPACGVTPRYAQSWVFWGFVFPIISWIRPYRMLSAVWRAGPEDDERRSSPVGNWWLTWLALQLAWTFRVDVPTAVLSVFELLTAGVAIRMVHAVTECQELTVPFSRSGVRAELRARAEGATAKVQLVPASPPPDAYRDPAEDWTRVTAPRALFRRPRVLELGPHEWHIAAQPLPVDELTKVIVRRDVGWLPFRATRYSLCAVDAEAGEYTLLSGLSAADAQVLFADLQRRLAENDV